MSLDGSEFMRNGSCIKKPYKKLTLKTLQQLQGGLFCRPQPAGFRPEKSSANQVLALTEHIEEGYEYKAITALVLVDLTFNTVNLRKMLSKVSISIGEK